MAIAGALVACPPAPLPKKAEAPVVQEQRDDGLNAALADAARGVRDAELRALLREHWAWALEREPTWATTLGVHAYDDRLADRSPRALAAARAKTKELLARAEGLAGAARAVGAEAAPSGLAKLDAGDALTLALFRAMLDDAVRSEVCRFEQWNVDARENPITWYNDLPRIQPLRDARDGERLVARYRQVPKAIDDVIANLRIGAGRKAFATAESVRRVLAMVDEQLAKPVDQWPMMPAADKLERATAAEREAFRAAVRAALEAVVPALGRYRAVLADEVMPHARPDEESGLDALPDGAACYAARIHAHTSMAVDPRFVHELGMEEIARTDAELTELGKAVGETTLGGTLTKLRGDSSLFFASKEEVLAAARSALADARGAIPAFFGRLPKTDCVVVEMPAHEQPFSTIAYYRPPHPDGSKPGEYVVNTLRPETRPRFEARVLAFHESIPGHHLQIAIQQELGDVPAFRKHAQSLDAFVEGWALYSERLADEMHLYKDDRDRLGVASFDAWRAGRLVVDTGIHALGWSRQLAIKFLTEHTALTPENIANEVDRYIAWPGQALSYKLGQREIRALRREAEAALGAKFALPAFHDAVLGAGPLPLPLLRARIQAWIRSQSAASDQ